MSLTGEGVSVPEITYHSPEDTEVIGALAGEIIVRVLDGEKALDGTVLTFERAEAFGDGSVSFAMGSETQGGQATWTLRRSDGYTALACERISSTTFKKYEVTQSFESIEGIPSGWGSARTAKGRKTDGVQAHMVDLDAHVIAPVTGSEWIQCLHDIRGNLGVPRPEGWFSRLMRRIIDPDSKRP